MTTTSTHGWTGVCRLQDLLPDTGIRALVAGVQVAVFRIADQDRLFALSAIDPFSDAAVLSRGIVGDIGGDVVVTSPIFKQHFRLADGVCVEDDSVRIPVFAVRLVADVVEVSVDPVEAA
jgi:NAD(P)H-dependent nitrite reductase small subunit